MDIQLYGHGCYSKNTDKISGWAYYVLMKDSGEIVEDSGVMLNSNTHIYAELRSITKGIQAISKLITVEDLADTTICIYANYEGIENWATGKWKARSTAAKAYLGFMTKLYSQGWKFKFETINKRSSNVPRFFHKVVENSANIVIEHKRGKSVNVSKNQITKQKQHIPKGEPVMLPKEDEIAQAVNKIANHKKKKRKKKSNNKKKKKKDKPHQDLGLIDMKSHHKEVLKREETYRIGKGSVTYNPDIFVI